MGVGDSERRRRFCGGALRKRPFRGSFLRGDMNRPLKQEFVTAVCIYYDKKVNFISVLQTLQ